MKEYDKIELIKEGKNKHEKIMCINNLGVIKSLSFKEFKRIYKKYKAIPIGFLPEDEKGKIPLAIALSDDLSEGEITAEVTFMEFELKRPIKAYIVPMSQIRDAKKMTTKFYKKYCK